MTTSFKYIITGILAVIFCSSQAQTTAPATAKKEYVKSYVGFFGGISLPVNDFKAIDYTNNNAGFAKKGVTFGIDGAKHVYKNLMLGGMFSFQDQGQLTTEDATILATGYTTSYKSDGVTLSATGRYHSLSLMAGPQYSFRFLKNFIADIRVAGGVLQTKSTPEVTVSLTGTPSQNGGNLVFYQREAKATNFAYSGSVGIRWAVSNTVSFVARGMYMDSKGPEIKTDNQTSVLGRVVTRQPYQAIQTTLGMNFSF